MSRKENLMVIRDNSKDIGLSIKRYIARMVDWSIYFLLCCWVMVLLFHAFFYQSKPMVLLSIYLSFGLMIIVEPLLLKFFGTTVGKFLFGIYVYTVNENKLAYQQGLERVLRVFFFGLGAGVPLVNTVCVIFAFVKAKNGQMLYWESGSMIVEKDRGWWAFVISIICMGLILFVLQFLNQNSILPINRGSDISEAELEENYEAYAKYFNINSPPELDIVQEEGVITQVSFEIELTERMESSMLDKYSYDRVAISALMAYVGAQNEIDYSEVMDKHMLELCNYSVSDRSFEFEIAGINVSADIEKKGYEDDVSSICLIPVDGEKQYYHLIFLMKKEK